MLIAGAGGHALEIFDVLIRTGIYDNTNIRFYDDKTGKMSQVFGKYPVVKSERMAEEIFVRSPTFCLGVGDPSVRSLLYNRLKGIGGNHTGVVARDSIISSNIDTVQNADIMSLSFIGPNVKIGLGSLINTRANVHHGCFIGEFTEISPSATILGNVSIGNFCRVGAGATVLPGVKIGDHVIIGAGALVRNDVPGSKVVYGVPARIIKDI